jgi:predicted dehydrogenase
MITLAQIGCGYWGPNLLRNFSAIGNCQVRYLVDTSEERRRFVSKNYPGTKAIDDIDLVFRDPNIQGIIIATPAATHSSLAKLSLTSGKHVFVEKPLATTVKEVDEIGKIAYEAGRQVMVGHTFVYNSAVKFIKNLIDRGELGDIRYIYSQRLNLGRIRSDVDALWNFAPHDISMVQYWLGDPEPIKVCRCGMDYVQTGIDDVVFINIEYPKKIIVNIHVSWLDPQKTRKTVIVGSKKMVVYDDASDHKIEVYDKGIDTLAQLGENMDYDNPRPFQFSYRSGDIVVPKIDDSEPLRNQALHFVSCIEKNAAPITGIEHARKVVAILEKANK